MYNNNKDFDFDLRKGKLNEKSIAKILGLVDQFECKHERDFWRKSGNICIELESYGKKSGIRATKAKYWCHSFTYNNEIVGFLIVETLILKQIVRKFIFKKKKEKQLKQVLRMLGDNKASKCVLIPMTDFIDLWRVVDVKRKNKLPKIN